MSDTGRIIRNILEERGISQKQLANTVGVTPATLSRWITGETEPPALDIITSIAKSLNVSADYLLGISPIPSVKKDFRPEEKILINCFRRATDDDITVLWALMNKYMSQNERIYMSQLNSAIEDIG